MHGKKVGGDNLHGLLEMGAKREGRPPKGICLGDETGGLDWIGGKGGGDEPASLA